MVDNSSNIGLSVGVVLYNPTIEDVQNINYYITSVNIVYVYDNSEKDNSDLLRQRLNSENYVYLHNGNNDGISIALNEILRIAKAQGYRYLILLDQDSIFEGEQMKQLFQFALNLKKNDIAMYVPYVLFENDRIRINKEWEFVDFAITSGNLLDIEICDKIGKFDEKLFIDGVDRDYCFRILKNNYKICRYNKVILKQCLGIGKKNIFGTYEHSVIRNYYIYRNRLYMVYKYPEIFKGLNKIKSLYLSIIKQVLSIVFCEKNKTEKLRIIKKATRDYKKGLMYKYQGEKN